LVVYWAALTLGPIVLALAVLLVSSGYFPSSGRRAEIVSVSGKFFSKRCPLSW